MTGVYSVLCLASPECAPEAHIVDLVIFACLHLSKIMILGLFAKLRIREISLFFSSAIILIIFARFLNSRICPPREYYQIYSSQYPANMCITFVQRRSNVFDVGLTCTNVIQMFCFLGTFSISSIYKKSYI